MNPDDSEASTPAATRHPQDRGRPTIRPAIDPPGDLPAGTTLRRIPIARGTELDLLVVPVDEAAAGSDEAVPRLAARAHAWVATPSPAAETVGEHQPPLMLPVYGSHVAWAPGRAAIIGPPHRLDLLQKAVADFAAIADQLDDLERRSARLLEAVEADAAEASGHDARGREAAVHYRESVAISRSLAVMATAVHAPTVYPPTLTSQVGERLRERARIAERHDVVSRQAELAERVADSCTHLAADAGIARRQTALEWAIVVLLVVQTVLLIVDLLAREGPP